MEKHEDLLGLEDIKTEEELNRKLIEFDVDFLCQKMEGLSIGQLIDFLRVSHKYYLSKKLPEIEQSLLHITKSFSETQSLLTSLALFFNDYKNKLIKHIRMEEKSVFPFIENLQKAQSGELSTAETQTLLKGNTIADFEDDHDPVEDELAEVCQVLFKFAKKTEAPLPFRVFLNQVALFELELRKHAAIEDLVLLPKVLALEKSLRKES